MLCIVMLFWAGNSIIGRAVRGEIPPFTLAFVRWTGALLLVAPIASRHLARDWPLLRRHWKAVLLLGLTGVAAFNAFLYSGLRHTTASNGLLLQAAIPGLVLAFDRLLFRARSTLPHLVAVTISTLGVVVIVFHGDPRQLLHFQLGIGDALVSIAVLCWALYTPLLRLRPAIHPASFIAVTFAIGAIAMLPLALSEWAAITEIHWRPAIFGAFAYVAIFPSVVAYFLFNRAVATLGAGRAGQVTTLMPVFGTLLAALLLREPLATYHLVGLSIILNGIVLAIVCARPR